jgi:hypothetical protein
VYSILSIFLYFCITCLMIVINILKQITWVFAKMSVVLIITNDLYFNKFRNYNDILIFHIYAYVNWFCYLNWLFFMDVLRPERLELRIFTHKTLQFVETTVNKYIIPLYISILTRDTILNNVRINSSQVC